MGGNFKIRVVENIGEDSEKSFGKPGTIHKVKNGKIIDLEGFEWSNDNRLHYSIEDVNNQLSIEDAEYYQTKFELVEEE